MSIINKYTGKLIVAGVALCMTMTSVLANTLSEVEVNQDGAGYGIVLKTDSMTQVKKTVSSSDRMSVVLKDVKVSENLNTVYNNVAKMDNITVQPIGKNDIKITLKGKGISNSKITFASSANVPAYPRESIQLSKPVSSYAPVYTPEKFVVEEEASQTANPQVNEVLTKMHVTREMLVTAKKYTKAAVKKAKSLLNGFDMNMLTMLGLFLIAAAFAFKPRKNSNSAQSRQKSIGLPARTRKPSEYSTIDREIALNKQMAENMNLRPTVQSNYGMKAYQQSQRNPYMSTGATNHTQTNGISGISRRKPSLTLPEPKDLTKEIKQMKNNRDTNVQINRPAVLQKSQASAEKTMTKIQTSPISKPAMSPSLPKEQTEIDSMKFLESITKIYENSGRTDLAKGLKDNLRKAQLSKAV